jgi:hypothetical protein
MTTRHYLFLHERWPASFRVAARRRIARVSRCSIRQRSPALNNVTVSFNAIASAIFHA